MAKKLGQKLKKIPAWAWGAGIVGLGGLAYLLLKPKTTSTSATSLTPVPVSSGTTTTPATSATTSGQAKTTSSATAAAITAQNAELSKLVSAVSAAANKQVVVKAPPQTIVFGQPGPPTGTKITKSVPTQGTTKTQKPVYLVADRADQLIAQQAGIPSSQLRFVGTNPFLGKLGKGYASPTGIQTYHGSHPSVSVGLAGKVAKGSLTTLEGQNRQQTAALLQQYLAGGG